MKLTLIGPQGCGKGTQAELINKEFGIPTYSTGELLREEKKKGTSFGKEITAIMDKGELVSDEIITKLVKNSIKEKKDYILDGFPRNLKQVKLAEENNIIFDKALYLTISDKTVMARLKGRETCRNCGRVYHVKLKKPKVKGKCDFCNGELYIRDDDTETAIKRRLEIYKKETEPIIYYFDKKGILIKIDAEREIKEIFEDVKEVLV